MKKIFISTLALLCLCNFIFSQAPQLINYQAIAHDNNGDPLTNKNITVRIGIISDAINGSLEWEEDHALTTNDYGLFSLKIGNGTSTNSGNQNSFANISWKNQIHFLNIQVDEGLGFEDLGTQQLVSVPYALFAKEAESVSNPTTSNLIDNQNGTFTYFNEIGLMTTFNANIDDADANPANELISSASLNNTSIEIIEGTVTHSIDLNPLLGAINDSDWVVDNNNIYSAVSGNVGIGTTNPTTPLQIDYTGQVGLQVNGNNSSWNSIYMNGNTTSGGIGYGYLRNSVFRGGTYLNSSDDWNLRLWDGSATLSRIYVKHSNGNTGICNTNPSEKLHISNGSIKIDDGSNPYTLPYSDGSANQILTTDGSGNLSWNTPPSITNLGWSLSGNAGTTNGTNFIGTTDAQDFDIRTNNLIRTTITQKGQIEVYNSGRSVFIGESAGENDDLSDNRNVFIGLSSGNQNTSGELNVAIGPYSLESNTTANYNVGLGYGVLKTNTTGAQNTAIGAQALYSNNTGTDNVAVGKDVLYFNESSLNTGIGSYALQLNENGMYNTALGTSALNSNVAGSYATAIGARAMLYANNNNTSFTNENVAVGYEALRGSLNPATNTGNKNTAIGYQSLRSNSTSNENTAIGNTSMYNNTTGTGMVANGFEALYSNTSGIYNTAIGWRAMKSNVTGGSNVALGSDALHSNTSDGNTAVGAFSLQANTVGVQNTAIGHLSMFDNTDGNYNVGLGMSSLSNNTSGNYNISIGYSSGTNNITGNNNTFIGRFADAGNANLSNATAIGANATVSTSNSLVLGNNVNVGIGTSSPSAKLDVVGTIQIDDGNQGAGKIFTSDASGNATWASNSIYTESGSLNNFSIDATTTWQQTGASFTVNKVYTDSKLEVTFNSRVNAGTFIGSSGILFEIRVDGVTADYDNVGAITTSGSIDYISMFAVFSGLSTGNHTIEVYARTFSGSTTNTLIDPGGWGGKMIAKETF